MNKYASRFNKILFDEGYKISEGNEYINSYTKITVVCPNGHNWHVQPNRFVNLKQRCPSCYYGNKREVKKIEMKKKAEKEGHKIIYSEYNDSNSKLFLKIKCPFGHIYEMYALTFDKGYRCRHCWKNKYKERFYEKLKEVGYRLSEGNDYVRATNNTSIVCSKGHEFITTPNSFFHGARCPKCDRPFSKGEKKINDILIDIGVEFCSELRLKKCRKKYALPFDFGVYENGKLILLIEYEGEQHYKPVDYFGGNEAFQETIENDNIKREYCKNNDIDLLEIPYWEYENIGKIIKEKLLSRLLT